jgi:ABC-2 type transport system permease protein
VLAGADASISLAAPGVLRPVIGSALFLAVTAVPGPAFGWLVRSTAGALAAVFGFLLVLPVLGLAVPAISPYLPSDAGAAILEISSEAGGFAPWVGFGLSGVYPPVVLAAAAMLLRRRDA